MLESPSVELAQETESWRRFSGAVSGSSARLEVALHLLERLWFTLGTWCFRRALEQDLDEELRHHIALETEAKERQGFSTEEAVRRARMAFGGFERVKEESQLELVDDLSRDLRLRLAPPAA